jgi:protocatechuate 3,4-dioxygenase, alpha subunit
MPGHSTPSQTAGPFFSIGFTWMNRAYIAAECAGERFTLRGRVLDGDGQPVPDASVEIWQADAEGRYHHPEQSDLRGDAAPFFGFGRVPTDTQGHFSFTTIKPGPVSGPGGQPQAPHLQISIFLRGLLQRLVTRMYFPDEPLNGSDPVLRTVPEPRRETLIARRTSGNSDALEWDLRLQGGNETVFFDC